MSLQASQPRIIARERVIAVYDFNVDDGAPLACEPQRAAAEPPTGVQHLFARCDAGLVGKEAVGVEQRLVVGLGRSVPDAIMQRVRVTAP